MQHTKAISLIQKTFYLFMPLLVYGVVGIISRYPFALLLGNIGVLGVLLSKFIPFFVRFREKKWKLSVLDYADVALWTWVIVGAFYVVNRISFISRIAAKSITSTLLVVALSLYLLHVITWAYNKSKGKNDAQLSDYE